MLLCIFNAFPSTTGSKWGSKSNPGHNAPKHPISQSSSGHWTFTPRWYLGVKGCRVMQELPCHLIWGSRGTEGKGKSLSAIPLLFLLPRERNPAKQGGQYNHMGELMAMACAKSSIHSQHFSRFKLCAVLDNQEDKASLSNPVFPALSSLPSKRACITGSFGDLPPANQHHQIPRMLPADALALLSGAGEGPSAGPRTGRNPHLQLNYPPTMAVCWGHGSR